MNDGPTWFGRLIASLRSCRDRKAQHRRLALTSGFNPPSRAEYCREKADQFLEMAASASNETVRSQFMTSAAEYDFLAALLGDQKRDA
jgi:hypothetical protein